MGAGKESIPPYVRKERSDVLNRAPYEKPPFTLGELKNAIPPHCFQRSVLRSFSYVVYDLTIAYVLYYVATNYIDLLSKPYNYLAWTIYGCVQGCVLTGFWVIAHECGHHAFSDYQLLDDTVGLVLHSCLFVPYFSWKYSHRRHHSNTNSIETDEYFVPKRKENMHWFSKYLNNPPGRIVTLLFTLSFGLQIYLLFNASGRRYERFASHYYPSSPIYSKREKLQIYISDIGILTVAYVLYRLVVAKGLTWVLCVYGGPLLVVNALIVVIVFLHHTHPSLPHYDSSEWDWLRGALATVDRDYGILNKVFHNITDTHVAHHLISTIPHYHAMEATQAIKPILGKYYQFDSTPVYKAMWRELKRCSYVEPDEDDQNKGVLWYSNKF